MVSCVRRRDLRNGIEAEHLHCRLEWNPARMNAVAGADVDEHEWAFERPGTGDKARPSSATD